MPPRLTSIIQTAPYPLRYTTEIPSFLIPFLHLQRRSASILGSLSDNPSAFSKPKRVGRGPSSGSGKTSGRGHKGQKQHGKVPRGFNGGQTKDEVVHGKRGDHNFASFRKDLTPLNLSKIQDWVSQGRLDPTRPITILELLQSRCVSNVRDGVKLLASKKDTSTTLPPINVIASRASASAIAAVEAAGGSVTTRYYTPFAVRQIKRGNMDPVNSLQSRIVLTEGKGEELEGERQWRYRLPDPTSRKDIEYYRDPAKRGYLSHLVPEGHGPSLFYKTPGTGSEVVRKARGKSVAAENRIW